MARKASDTIFGVMDITNNDANVLNNYCNLSKLRQEFRCRIFIFTELSKVHPRHHRQYLTGYQFPVLVIQGSNCDQVNKTKQSINKALKETKNHLKHSGSTTYPSKTDATGLAKNTRARRKRDRRLNRWKSSK